MMNIVKTENESTLIVALDGRLSTAASQELENELRPALSGIAELIFDLEKLEYITSGGLRVLIFFQKQMKNQGTMKIRNVSPEIMKIFKMVGLVNVLSFE